MWAHEFCLFFHTFITHNFLYHYAIALQSSTLSKHLIGIMMQVTEWTYTFQYGDMTCRAMGCSLCLLALFSQARSHIILVFLPCSTRSGGFKLYHKDLLPLIVANNEHFVRNCMHRAFLKIFDCPVYIIYY